MGEFEVHVEMERARPRLGDVCPFCGRACRVPLTRWMPRPVVAAYDLAKLDSLATCEEGAADEQRRMGVSYADVVAQRVERLRYSP